MLRALLLASIFLLLAGCQITHSKEVVNKVPKSPESTMAVKNLATGNEELVRYTASEHAISSNINNIDISIEALYNSNNKKYTYIMKMRDTGPIENQGKNGPYRYKILRITAGVEADNSTGQYKIYASSPLYKDGAEYKLEGSYVLFTDKQKFLEEQFLIEAFFTNDEPIDDREPGTLTLRGYFESGESILYD